jgi:hypothetical protein
MAVYKAIAERSMKENFIKQSNSPLVLWAHGLVAMTVPLQADNGIRLTECSTLLSQALIPGSRASNECFPAFDCRRISGWAHHFLYYTKIA